MRSLFFSVVGFALVLATSSCAKKAVVQKPADTAPVASASAPTPSRTPAAKPAPQANRTPQPVAQAKRPGTLTPQERATLNDRLARLEDALFDYDRSSIRSDATTALKDDVGVI